MEILGTNEKEAKCDETKDEHSMQRQQKVHKPAHSPVYDTEKAAILWECSEKRKKNPLFNDAKEKG